MCVFMQNKTGTIKLDFGYLENRLRMALVTDNSGARRRPFDSLGGAMVFL